MKTKRQQLFEKIRKYHFELKHLMVVFAILVLFQLITSFVQRISLRNFLVETQKWYQQDFAERVANLTATSLELLLETTSQNQIEDEESTKKMVQAFNTILSQQLLQHHVQEVCILISIGNETLAIDNGHVLYSYIFKDQDYVPPPDVSHLTAIKMYNEIQGQIIRTEETHSILEGKQTFHVFVPFVPKGEYFGALYMKSTPTFGFVTSGIMASSNETNIIFTGLILFGLMAMFYISSHTVKERDEAQRLLFQEREQQIKEQVHHQKEALFTKRIYHTHHKAEKVMGFIKDDLRVLSPDSFNDVKYRITKYANFISRVIYDMKWFDPPLQAIRNPIFKTDINDLLQFLVKNVFLRVSTNSTKFRIELDFDEKLPFVHINEYVVWEIVEPLIQNCIDHGDEDEIVVRVGTRYFPEKKESIIFISDNGRGIQKHLLAENEKGIKAIFLENVTTKADGENSGYGCYIAYEISKQRCGWSLDAENLQRGARFTITIPN